MSVSPRDGAAARLHFFGIYKTNKTWSGPLYDSSEQLTPHPMKEGTRKQHSDRLLYARAKDLMENHQVFLEVGLTLNALAERLQRSRTSLSSVINHETGQNFSLWVASYRINYFVEQYYKEGGRGKIDYQKYGFASRSSFYRLFHTFKGCSPHEYFQRRGQEERMMNKAV